MNGYLMHFNMKCDRLHCYEMSFIERRDRNLYARVFSVVIDTLKPDAAISIGVM